MLLSSKPYCHAYLYSSSMHLKPTLETDTEKALTQAWTGFLGKTKIAATDDFFALGGNQLLFTALIKNLEKRFDIALSEITSQKIGIFYKQLEILNKKIGVLKRHSLITIRDGSTKNPIVFIHAIGGTLFSYIPLIQKLKTERAILGIQDGALSGKIQYYDSLEDQASFYIKQIKEEVDFDSITLAGHSAGGTIAFEMMHQLLKENLRVDHLIMLDSWSLVPFDITFRDNFKKIILRQMDRIKLHHFFNTQKEIDNWLDILWQRMTLLLKYRPTVAVNGRATLFISPKVVEEYTVNIFKNQDWGNYIRHLTTHEMEGTHEDILSIDSNLEKMAKIIQAIIT